MALRCECCGGPVRCTAFTDGPCGYLMSYMLLPQKNEVLCAGIVSSPNVLWPLNSHVPLRHGRRAVAGGEAEART